MIALIIGGSGSGKSAYAEKLVGKISSGNRIYIATMRIWDDESRMRIERHRRQRASLGFETVECPVRIGSAAVPEDATVLLEDIPNLVANEMFDDNGDTGSIIPALEDLARRCRNLIMVTGNVFADGESYGGSTADYLPLLASVNAAMAKISDYAAEIVYGIPVPFKGEKICV